MGNDSKLGSGCVVHTPGPWLADFHNEQRAGGRFITHVRGGNQLVPIAAVPTGVEGYGREEGRANARLIAVAPDLWEAGKEAEWFLAHYAEYIASVPVDEIERHPYLPDLQEKLEMLRAALAKADPLTTEEKPS